MPVIEEPISAVRDQDLFLGTQGIHPNCVTTINPEQAERLEGENDETPSSALHKAFEIRKQNQAKSRTSK